MNLLQRQNISQPVSQVVKQCGFKSFLQDFIRDMVQKGAVKLQYISTNEQIADHPRHDTDGSNEALVSRDKLGVM
jgi:hypothetical protein